MDFDLKLEADYKITEQDYLNAMRLNNRMTKKGAFIFGFLTSLFLLFSISGSGAIQFISIGGAAGIILVLVFSQVIISFIARSNYREYKTIQESMRVGLRDDGIEFSTPDGGGLMRWEKIFKWRQNEKYLLIYTMPRLYYVIPKKIEESGFHVPTLISALREKVGSEA
jgi:hypothetical protein